MNCLTYALKKWSTEGGYLLIRRSHFGHMHKLSRWHPLYWSPHFLHVSKYGHITQFVPSINQLRIDFKRGPILSYLTIWSFEGCIVKGDNEEILLEYININ